MADSHTAGLIQYIRTLTPTPALGGIGPTPVPYPATMPYVTVREIMGKELECVDGTRVGTIMTVMQVEVWSKDYEQANSIREQLKSSILEHSGATGTLTVAGPINHVTDAELYNDANELHQRVTRYLIWWNE